MDRRQDPRTLVTPYAFSVHPDLLGMPLATPWQRLGAIAIDGVVIVGLSRIGGPTLAAASSLLLFWLAFRGPGQNVIGKLFRVAAGCMGLMVGTLAVILLFTLPDGGSNSEGEEDDSGRSGVTLGKDIEGAPGGVLNLLEAIPRMRALKASSSAEEARPLLMELAQIGREAGLSLQDIRATLEGVIPEDAPWSGEGVALVDEVVASMEAELGEDPESTRVGPESVVPITDPQALDSIQALNTLVQTRDEELQDAEEELRQVRALISETREVGLVDRLKDLLDDLGLGFGWGALYLTIAHALMKGSSVGKKLLRIRVVMIDLRPLTWWLSFERVGGYAAGLATGLLGFAQVFWDPNRQAIHDKVSETVVIQVGRDPVPGPWMAEGRAQWDRSRSHPPGVQN